MLYAVIGGSVRARSWKTALTYRSSPAASCTLWSSQRHSRKTLDATHALHRISMARTPRRQRSMWKVIPLSFLADTFAARLSPVNDRVYLSEPTGASSSDSDGEQHFEHEPQ